MKIEKSMNKNEIIQALEDITQEPGFLYSLAIFLRENMFFKSEEIVEH